MNKPSKSKAETHELTMAVNIGHWHYAFRNHSALFECAHCKKQQRRNTNFLGNRFELQCDGVKFHRVPRNRLREEVNRHDIIARMEAAQQRFGSFPSLLVSSENERRLQLEDRADWIQNGDPPALPGESELDYNERTGRYDEHMVEGTLSNFDRYIAGDR